MDGPAERPDAQAAIDGVNQRIFDTSLDLILVVDPYGSFQRISPSSLAILGYEPVEMIGHSAQEFLYPADLENTRNEMRLARYGQMTRNFECRYVHKDGRVVPLWWTGLWSVPEHLYFFIGRDMSERKETEAQLRAALQMDALLREGIDNMPEGFAIYDDEERLVVFNASYKRLVPEADIIAPGVTLEAILRYGISLGLFPDAVGHEEEWIAERRQQHRTQHGVIEQQLSDGRWVLVSKYQMSHGHTIGLRVDITEIKKAQAALHKAEEQLRQAQKVEALGKLTGGMAHDFNNMLVVILGSLDMAKSLITDDDAAELVQEAIDAATSAADLTRGLLAFARKQPLRPERIGLNEQITKLARLLDRVIGKAITINLDLADDLWPVVIDTAQLDAALANLTTNARDALPTGGHLTILTANHTLDAASGAVPGDYTLIQVSDNGIGMTPEVCANIFEPFFTTKSTGTGLGLSMVSEFVKQSGGHLSVDSKLGSGTTFRLYLPAARNLH